MNIDFTKDTYVCGKIGENNADNLVITVPTGMRTEGSRYRIAFFGVGNELPVRTEELTMDENNKLTYALTNGITSMVTADVTLEEYNGDDVIRKSDMFHLIFDPAVPDGEDGVTNSTPVIEQINANTDARHTHSNKGTVDKLGESDGKLTFDGAEVRPDDYTAGDGISISSNEISVKIDGESVVLNDDGELEADVDIPEEVYVFTATTMGYKHNDETIADADIWGAINDAITNGKSVIFSYRNRYMAFSHKDVYGVLYFSCAGDTNNVYCYSINRQGTLTSCDYNNASSSDLSTLSSRIVDLRDGKVDKINGKQLSTCDYTPEERSKLTGIEAGANNYTLPTASDSTLGGVKVDGSTITIDSNGVISSQGGSGDVADVYVDGASVLDSDNIAQIDLTGKQNTVYYGSTEPEDATNGDIWVDSSDTVADSISASDVAYGQSNVGDELSTLSAQIVEINEILDGLDTALADLL